MCALVSLCIGVHVYTVRLDNVQICGRLWFQTHVHTGAVAMTPQITHTTSIFKNDISFSSLFLCFFLYSLSMLNEYNVIYIVIFATDFFFVTISLRESGSKPLVSKPTNTAYKYYMDKNMRTHLLLAGILCQAYSHTLFASIHRCAISLDEPFQQVHFSHFHPATAAQVNCKRCYCAQHT